MSGVVLTTGRLVLRRLREGDLEAQLALLNTPAVMAHLGGVQPRAVIAEKHARTRALWEREGFGFMMMEERDGGALVGHCGMKRVDHPQAPNPCDHEIGWLVREDRWRRGYAFEAMLAVIAWAFAVHDAPHLVALTSAANVGSWRLMEKLGMTRRADCDFRDPAASEPIIQYAITRPQWESQK
ncbi:MAG: GNAT family N-acetyltransferase [Porphyrobacter sp.]|nr:GNAT family N-acetyltransferase [Porphyrobacter sp.]